MKILLVEDDEHKCKDVINCIKSHDRAIDIKTAVSAASGIRYAMNESFDLILLDMTIPNFDITSDCDGGKALSNGGEFIVKFLLDEEKEFRCAVITQYGNFKNDSDNKIESIEEINNRIHNLCGNNYLGYIKYHTIKDSWQIELKNLIKNVKNIINR